MLPQATTVFSNPRQPKKWSWSYSRLKNFESCARRHYHVDVKKDVKEEDGGALGEGQQLHDHLAKRIGKGIPLPPTFSSYEKWAQKVLGTPGDISVELELAITEDLLPTTWFANDVWFRAKVDVLKRRNQVGLMIDWKTGKIIEDSVQLVTAAQAVFSHYPELEIIQTMYVWFKEDATTTVTVMRKDMPGIWAGVMPRIITMRNAYASSVFGPRPSGLCRKYCPVPHSMCEHRGT